MELNIKNNLFNEGDNDDFLISYNKLIQYINENHLIDYIEDAYKITCTSELNGTMIGRLNNILVRLFDGQLEYIETLSKFMQTPNINFNNRTTSNAQINARLRRMRDIYFECIMAFNNMVSDPFNISGTATSVQEKSPSINLTLSRNDLTQFSCTLNFNSLLNMLCQLVSVAGNKLNSGNNIIDVQLLNRYLEESDNLNSTIIQFKKSKDIH
ncbi:hypothetical protein [Clostridium sp. OS1-26]|uniref:hypothetical protein n=1 Tax=Clostridium sp. OS1-26 TaxID=3070681 RepID=UPI0027E0FE04|nr:hypothetical protein [Clostridium sp. OS1-26]WML35654.1 hypothetical protein RCG18_02560 [Clostridium sp. OS1-26]